MDERILTIRVVCRDLPGVRFDEGRRVYEPVHLAVQRGKEAVNAVPADRKSATFTLEFRVGRSKDGRPNFLGPYAQGTPKERFFYLVWGEKKEDGRLESFRRLKVPLHPLGWKELGEGGEPLEVRLRLTDARGGPLCATARGEHVEWRIPSRRG